MEKASRENEQLATEHQELKSRYDGKKFVDMN